MRLRKTNNWHRFAAVETHDAAVRQLRLFWERWECLHPNHEIFRIRDKESLGRTLPMLVHGDEGRGPKRQAVMCLSAASILGHGVATKSKRGNRSDVQLMNYIGHTFITRFLLGILPKKAYENCPAAFHQFVRKFAEDLRCLATDGVISSITGQTHYVAVLHIKGDWPFLAKVGELTRSFSNQPKQASSQKPCTGICHYCLAGRPDIPFEDMSMDAEWQFSVGVERPWKSTPVIFKIPHDDTFPESFLAADPFHTWHLGEGRNFVANCVAMMLEQAPVGNVETKLDWLFLDYQRYCKSHRRQCYAMRFNANLFRIGNDFPTGSWTKGNFTTSLVKWVDHFMNARRNSYPANSAWQLAVSHRVEVHVRSFVHIVGGWFLFWRFMLCWWIFPSKPYTFQSSIQLHTHEAQAAHTINSVWSRLYLQPLWVPSRDAQSIAQQAFVYMDLFMQLAGIASQQSETMWLLNSKCHMLSHIFKAFNWEAELAEYALNPLSLGVQMEEDLIGKSARINRHVAPALQIQRTMQRYLVATFGAWCDAKMIDRVGDKCWGHDRST